MKAAKAAAKKAANARGRDQWMRATLVCRHKRRRVPRLRSRPERASDMHPQAPNTQTFLPACLLSTACDYNGLDCFDQLDLTNHCLGVPSCREHPEFDVLEV